MKPTHRCKEDRKFVTAWQFGDGKDMPVWVFRKFHRTPYSDSWTAITTDDQLAEAEVGDWAVAYEVENPDLSAASEIYVGGNTMAVLVKAAEFDQKYEAI